MANQSPQSYNSRIKISLRQFLLPMPADIALYLFLSLMTLLLLNARDIWNYFSSQNLSGETLGNLIGQNTNTQGVQNYLTRLSQGRILQGLFWAVIGIFMYILVWSIKNIVVNIRNDIVADEYIHPIAYKRSRYWRSVIGRKVAFAVTITVLVAYIYSCLRLIPALGRLCQDAVVNFSWSSSIVELVGSWLGVGVLIYLFILLGRISIIEWRLIYSDL